MSNDKKEKQESLSQNSILIAEYNYIVQSIFQANEDRARVTNFYLVTLGSFIAAMFSNNLFTLEPSEQMTVNIGFGVLFLLLTFQGTMTLMQLARLRGAWFEGVRAMNQIKNYYKHHFQDQDIEKAFRWGDKTLPKRFKPNSVGFLLAMQVALLSGFSLAAAFVVFTIPIFSRDIILYGGITIIILSVIILMRVFKHIIEK
jgi:hypothetical protein